MQKANKIYNDLRNAATATYANNDELIDAMLEILYSYDDSELSEDAIAMLYETENVNSIEYLRKVLVTYAQFSS